MILVRIPTNNWIVLFHPRNKNPKQPRAPFHCSMGFVWISIQVCEIVGPRKGLFYTWKVTWHIPPLLRNFYHTSSVLGTYTPFNLTCQVTSESLGLLYLGKHLFAKSSGQIITENGKVYPHLYTHVFYRKLPVDFFVCLQGTTPPNKLLETHNSPKQKCDQRSHRTNWNSWRSRHQGGEQWTDLYGQGLPTKRPPGHQLCASLNRILPMLDLGCVMQAQVVLGGTISCLEVPFRMYIYVQKDIFCRDHLLDPPIDAASCAWCCWFHRFKWLGFQQHRPATYTSEKAGLNGFFIGRPWS